MAVRVLVGMSRTGCSSNVPLHGFPYSSNVLWFTAVSFSLLGSLQTLGELEQPSSSRLGRIASFGL